MVCVMKNKTLVKQSSFIHTNLIRYNNCLVHKYLRGNSFYTPSFFKKQGNMDNLDRTRTVLLTRRSIYMILGFTN